MNTKVGLRRRVGKRMIDREMLAGLVFMAAGIVAVAVGWGYGFGSFAALGAGAMPVLVGAGLIGLGAVQLLQARVAMRAGEALVSAFPRAELRPLAVILAAVLVFALLVDRVGLVPALVALVGISWFAERGGRGVELAAVMVVVVLLIVAIFYWGLGIPFRLVAWRF